MSNKSVEVMYIKEMLSIKKDFCDCALNLTQTTAEKMCGKLSILKQLHKCDY